MVTDTLPTQNLNPLAISIKTTHKNQKSSSNQLMDTSYYPPLPHGFLAPQNHSGPQNPNIHCQSKTNSSLPSPTLVHHVPTYPNL